MIRLEPCGMNTNQNDAFLGLKTTSKEGANVIDIKIKKLEKQMSHLTNMQAHRKTHGGKRFRSKQISLRNQIDICAQKIYLLNLEKEKPTSSKKSKPKFEFSDKPNDRSTFLNSFNDHSRNPDRSIFRYPDTFYRSSFWGRESY